jgi:hypothetical protein
VLTRDRSIGTPLPTARAIVHDLYGIRVRTPWPVTGVPAVRSSWDVEFLPGDPRTLDEAARHVDPAQRTAWVQHAVLPDGSRYRRWTGLFDFLVAPDARRIQARMLDRANEEALLAYLLVDGLSYSMVRLGHEPVHATAVLTDRGTAAFVGASGDGKSTLAALLVRDGCRLVTDDMLVLTHERAGCLAHPGPPRIKLYRSIAEAVFGGTCAGVPMNPVTEKLIVALGDRQTVRTPVPLTAMYLIDRDDRALCAGAAPKIDRLSPARAFPRVLAATTAHYPGDRERLARQLEFVSRLVSRVPVKTLAYRRDVDDAGILRDAVLADLDRTLN